MPGSSGRIDLFAPSIGVFSGGVIGDDEFAVKVCNALAISANASPVLVALVDEEVEEELGFVGVVKDGLGTGKPIRNCW